MLSVLLINHITDLCRSTVIPGRDLNTTSAAGRMNDLSVADVHGNMVNGSFAIGIEKYRSSSRYAKENLTADEKEIFDDGWVLDTKSLP